MQFPRVRIVRNKVLFETSWTFVVRAYQDLRKEGLTHLGVNIKIIAKALWRHAMIHLNSTYIQIRVNGPPRLT